MKRFLMVYLPLLLIGAMLWSTLRPIGLLDLPGDMLLDLQGARIGAPFATSLVIALTVNAVWRILEP